MKSKIVELKRQMSSGNYFIQICPDIDGKKIPKEYTVSEADYMSIGSPAKGDTLLDEELSVITRETMREQALERALKIVGAGQNNRRMLHDKLAARGFDAECVRYAVDEVSALGYINEDSQIESIILEQANRKKYGKRKIMQYLIGHGYPRDKADEVLRRLTDDGTVDFDRIRTECIALYKLTDPLKQRQELYKKGF